MVDVTKDDLRAAIQEMRTELYRALAVQTLIFACIVAALTKLQASTMTSPLATKEDLEAAAHRLRDQLRFEVWRALALQTVILAGVVVALARL